MSIYRSLPDFAEAPTRAILCGLNAASPQSLIEPTPFSYEQRRFTTRVQEYYCLVAPEVPRIAIRKEPCHGFACIGWIKENTLAACSQADSLRAFWCSHAIARPDETAVDVHILCCHGSGKSQPLDGSLS